MIELTLLRKEPRLRAVTPVCLEAGTVSQAVDDRGSVFLKSYQIGGC